MIIILMPLSVEFMMSDTMPVVIQEDKKTWVDKVQSLDGFGIIVLPRAGDFWAVVNFGGGPPSSFLWTFLPEH